MNFKTIYSLNKDQKENFFIMLIPNSFKVNVKYFRTIKEAIELLIVHDKLEMTYDVELSNLDCFMENEKTITFMLEYNKLEATVKKFEVA